MKPLRMGTRPQHTREILDQSPKWSALVVSTSEGTKKGATGPPTSAPSPSRLVERTPIRKMESRSIGQVCHQRIPPRGWAVRWLTRGGDTRVTSNVPNLLRSSRTKKGHDLGQNRKHLPNEEASPPRGSRVGGKPDGEARWRGPALSSDRAKGQGEGGKVKASLGRLQ